MLGAKYDVEVSENRGTLLGPFEERIWASILRSLYLRKPPMWPYGQRQEFDIKRLLMSHRLARHGGFSKFRV